MSIHVALNHVTHYRYDRAIALSPQVVRLRPAPHSRTPVLSYSLRVTPANHFVNWQQDPQSNWLARIVFPERARELKLEVDLIAEMSVINPFDFFLEPYAEKFPFKYEDRQLHELTPYLVKLPATPLFKAYLAEVPREPKPTNQFLVELNHRVQKDVRYVIRFEPGVQTPEETLALGSGSCRDSGWLLVQLLRHLGLAARFVSGYLIQLKPDVKPLEGPAGTEVDFTDLHAWCEVYLPGAGWVGLDPTSGLLAGEGHIPLACTSEPASAAPLTGLTEQCQAEFSHAMKVDRVWEAPRVTKPYSDADWLAMEALGDRVDAKLESGDVRLTQGGEPTFVSIDDLDGPEWNITALSPKKRSLAEKLTHRLKARFAPGAMLHFGQGKWYPGEPLPRWALGVYWRVDGKPIWRDETLVAQGGKDYGFTPAQAKKFIEVLAGRLSLDPGHVIAAFEDVWQMVHQEQALPVNVDPLKADLKDPDERKRLARLLERGLGEATGYVLPLKPTDVGWRSSRWPLKRDRLYLLAGDSPMGLRLPLATLPWVPPEELDSEFPLDPFEVRPGLDDSNPKERPKPPEIIHTALCVEVRDGQLYVFIPPVTRIEDYLSLIAVVEDTASSLKMPLRLEGYAPPRDPRVRVLAVTPDPGVIEVNIHPASSWRELSDNFRILYEEAREARLGTEKFMLDGRHTGTGGGNHVTLGGPTPADSPWLRRPDLLKSFITYWQNHPALSFLFSGAFIGPTSQAPRVDEARDDSLYELGIAFQQMGQALPGAKESERPWLVDRLLRNLLTDLTGNTHRAEFCIDKLYSPEGPAGRLGLVELRAFEMPPHARMSLCQMLLLRALVARFWHEPYEGKLVSWGTQLHDRWMLPHFAAQDIRDVARDLQRAGYAFEERWFDPFIEFRFPRYGEFAASGVRVELRAALEPWHVMGEENTAGATARYVDSSVERLQVKATGLVSERHALTCNGRRVPLHPTGNASEYVAGVRYRAWQPPSALHPTIGVHTPLVFDLVDTWMSHSLGGCQYHVSHPGGRHHDSFPVNAYEAEGRRLSRFLALGHTPGCVEVRAEERNPNLPFTLDLRRA